jgi:YhcG PDDEXK nuclease domain
MSEMNPQDYASFLHEIKQQIRDRQLQAIVSGLDGLFPLLCHPHQLKVSGQENFDGQLLFNRRLRCLVAIELKIGDFKPEHKGKMEFYLEALDCQEKVEGENPPIGIIICRSKNKTVVEYALRSAVRPIGVATYTIVPQLPEAYRDELPSPEAIAERLQLWADREVDDE